MTDEPVKCMVECQIYLLLSTKSTKSTHERKQRNSKINKPLHTHTGGASSAMSYITYIAVLTMFTLMTLMHIQPPGTAIQQDGHFLYAEPSQPISEDAYPTTIVTAYYPLGDAAKHTSADYDAWMSNFFPCVKAPMVVFLPAGPMVERVKTLRGKLPLTVKVSTSSYGLVVITTGTSYIHNPCTRSRFS